MQFVDLSLKSSQLSDPEPSLFRAVVLSGPLGSGKTELLNRIMSLCKDSIGSYVIIENDIGSDNVDKARLDADPARILALTSGCICCNDITSFRFHVSRLKELPHADQPDTLLIETTGIAHPSEVKRALYELNVPSLMIVTVDVAHYKRNDLLRPAKNGIQCADVIAFTWWDHLEDPTVLHEVVKSVDEFNPTARKLFVRGDGEIFGLSGGPEEVTAPDVDGRPLHSLTIDDLSLAKYQLGEGVNKREREGSDSRAEDTPLRDIVELSTHREQPISLTFLPHLSADEIIHAVTDVAGKSLVRVKGRLNKEDINCTHGDWKRKPRTEGSTNTLNIITTSPVRLAAIEHLLQKEVGDEEIDLSDPTTLSHAIQLVEELICDFPKNVISHRGNLTTECDSGEGWRYIYLEGFPEDVRDRFLGGLVHFYHEQLKTLQSGVLNDHPSFPFYMKEVGANVSWLLIDCSDLLTRLGLREEIEKSKPFSRYFTGLRSLTLPGQLNRLRPQDLPYLDARIDGLVKEVGEEEARREIRSALKNAQRLSFDDSWKSISERYSSLLS